MSNRLGDLGEHLGFGGKMPTGGIALWVKCMAGDKKSWNKMVKYCKRDVLLLEKVYLKLRPYMASHTNLGVYTNRPVCAKCGSGRTIYRGFSVTNAGKFRRFQCNKCGGWGRDRNNILEHKTTVSI